STLILENLCRLKQRLEGMGKPVGADVASNKFATEAQPRNQFGILVHWLEARKVRAVGHDVDLRLINAACFQVGLERVGDDYNRISLAVEKKLQLLEPVKNDR